MQLLSPEDTALRRAVANYLAISRNAPNYASVAGYAQAEEKSWERLQEALAAQREAATAKV